MWNSLWKLLVHWALWTLGQIWFCRIIMGPVFKASNGRHRKFESLNYFLINFTSPGTVLGYLKFNTKECLSIFDSFKKLLLLLLFMFC